MENYIPTPNSLSNGIAYTATIKTYNSNGDVSEESDPILFTCIATPQFNINLMNHTTIKNASYEFSALYSGSDTLSEYNFKLYDALTNTLLQISDTYSAIGSTKYSCIFNKLENNTQYKIKAFGITSGGLLIETPDCYFDVSYIQSGTYANVKFENLSDKGCIKTSSSLTSLEGEIDGEKNFIISSSIDLTNGQTVRWIKDFSITSDFILKIKCTDIQPFKTIFKAVNSDITYAMYLLPVIRNNEFYLEVTIKNYNYTTFLLSNKIATPLSSSDNINICIKSCRGSHLVTIEKESEI